MQSDWHGKMTSMQNFHSHTKHIYVNLIDQLILFPSAFVIAYTILGAFVFSYLEQGKSDFWN